MPCACVCCVCWRLRLRAQPDKVQLLVLRTPDNFPRVTLLLAHPLVPHSVPSLLGLAPGPGQPSSLSFCILLAIVVVQPFGL